MTEPTDTQGQMPGDTPPTPPPPKLAQEVKEMDVAIAKTFATANGKKVLKWLRDNHIEQPVLQISDGLSGILAGYAREGQNSLVRLIEQRIKRASK